ncbi:hypothetical protein FPRO06_11010 [Fusarium proliferatum]|nr:hypothetical protein FPRO06_11010 [Fusarium proliferatum]
MASAALKAIDDISYWDSDGFLTVKNISDDQRATLNKYLVERYRLVAYTQSLPFLVMECHGSPPDDPPFPIAGAIAIWRDANDIPFLPVVGDFAIGDVIEVEDDIVDQIVWMEIPSKDIILYLANLWPECQAITFLWTTLVVELPLVSQEHYWERLQDLPGDLEGSLNGCCYVLMFNNGPLPNAEITRESELNPDPEQLFRPANHKLGDLFLVDYAAGVTQTVCYFGRRFTFGWKRVTPHDFETRTSQSEDSVHGAKYIAFEQAAFVTNVPETATGCATVPLRSRSESLRQRQPRQSAVQECGILYMADDQLRSSSRIDTFIMYADSYDPKIDEQS